MFGNRFVTKEGPPPGSSRRQFSFRGKLKAAVKGEVPLVLPETNARLDDAPTDV